MATSSSMNRSKWNAIYEHKRNDSGDTPPANDWLKERIIHVLPLGASVLELGCGRGSLSSFLAEHGYNVLAVDFSGTALDLIEPNSHLKTLEMDLTEDFPEGQFDAIIAHHFYDRKLISNMKKALTPTGQIIIKTFDERIFLRKPKFNTDWVLRERDFLSAGWLTIWHQFEAPSSDSAVIAWRAKNS